MSVAWVKSDEDKQEGKNDEVNVKLIPGKMMTGPGKKLYPFQWIYRLNIKGFYFFPYIIMVLLFIGVVPLILYSVGIPFPQQTSLPFLGEMMEKIGIFNDRDLFVIATWLIWWPIFIFSILAIRRIWCGGFCPFGLVTDVGNWVGKILRGGKEPRAISMTDYVFMGFLTFLIIGYLHDAVNITNSIIMSVEFVMFFFMFAFIVGVMLPRRSFCRSFCFVGCLPHLFGRLAFLGLKTDRRKCESCEGKWCQTSTNFPPHGIAELKAPLINVDGCPMFLNVPQLGHIESNRHCILCGNCVKNCPYDAIHYQYLKPGYEIEKGLQLNGHETFFTLGIVTVLAMFIAMEGSLLGKWGDWLTIFLELPTTKFHWLIVGTYVLMAAAIIFAAYFLVSTISATLMGISKKRAAMAFGYVYLPFAYLMFFRDILVVYLVDGSIIQTWFGMGPQWLLVLVPFIEIFMIVGSSFWGLYLATKVSRILWKEEHEGEPHWTDVWAGALPHMVYQIVMAGYWLNQIFPEHAERLVMLGIEPFVPFLIPVLFTGFLWVSGKMGLWKWIERRLDPADWELEGN